MISTDSVLMAGGGAGGLVNTKLTSFVCSFLLVGFSGVTVGGSPDIYLARVRSVHIENLHLSNLPLQLDLGCDMSSASFEKPRMVPSFLHGGPFQNPIEIYPQPVCIDKEAWVKISVEGKERPRNPNPLKIEWDVNLNSLSWGEIGQPSLHIEPRLFEGNEQSIKMLERLKVWIPRGGVGWVWESSLATFESPQISIRFEFLRLVFKPRLYDPSTWRWDLP